MSKEQRTKKNDKKKPLLNQKEKRAQKKAKQSERGGFMDGIK